MVSFTESHCFHILATSPLFYSFLTGIAETRLIQCDADIALRVGALQPVKLLRNNNSVLLQSLMLSLPTDRVPVAEEWEALLNKDILEERLNAGVANTYRNSYHEQC